MVDNSGLLIAVFDLAERITEQNMLPDCCPADCLVQLTEWIISAVPIILSSALGIGVIDGVVVAIANRGEQPATGLATLAADFCWHSWALVLAASQAIGESL